MTRPMMSLGRRLAAAALLAVFALGSPARAADPQPDTAEARATRWDGQSTRLANRKSEVQDRIRQTRAEIDRLTNVRTGLEKERDQKVQQMLNGTLRFAGDAETNGGAFLRGLLGGATTRMVADEYNKAIGTATTNIATVRGYLTEWETEGQQVAEREAERAAWPKYRGHRYPVVQPGDIEGAAKGLDIRAGDLYLAYNGASMAYAMAADLAAPRDAAARNNTVTVEVLFVRDGKLIRHTVPGGKPLGVMVRMPISE